MISMNPLDLGEFIRSYTFLGLNFLEFAGLFVTVHFIVIQVGIWLEYLWSDFICIQLGLLTDLKKLGQWAVVTGASDGIGKAYCDELGKRGLNLVLISRTREKLQAVAAELELKHKIQTRIVAVDFTGGLDIYDEIKKELEGLEIGVLVNNVGMFYPYVDFFSEHAPENSMNIIKCNVIATTMMMHLVLPQMNERERGAIINIGSISGVTPMPLLSVYGATKTYVDMLTQSLELEYRSKNIIIQSVVPGYVATKMAKIREPSWAAPTPEAFVAKAIQTVGVLKRTAVHISHRFALRGLELDSYLYWYPTTWFLLRITKGLREKSVRKRMRATSGHLHH